MCTIIGRKQEIAELNRYYGSGRAEFIAIYGRRRVGKTFLINEVLGDYMTFHHTGLSPYDRKRKVTLKDQLQNFHFSLIRHGMENGNPPKSWMEAFFMLEQLLERQDNGLRQVVFIDELPWMDTPRSGFLDGYGEIRFPHGTRGFLERMGQHAPQPLLRGLWLGNFVDSRQPHQQQRRAVWPTDWRNQTVALHLARM